MCKKGNIMGKKTEFLYLNEEEIIEAGALDYARCIDVEEEIFKLLSVGDYVMGGDNHNSHGIMMKFPKESEFEGMPLDGPDRRFMAMPACEKPPASRVDFYLFLLNPYLSKLGFTA